MGRARVPLQRGGRLQGEHKVTWSAFLRPRGVGKFLTQLFIFLLVGYVHSRQTRASTSTESPLIPSPHPVQCAGGRQAVWWGVARQCEDISVRVIMRWREEAGSLGHSTEFCKNVMFPSGLCAFRKVVDRDGVPPLSLAEGKQLENSDGLWSPSASRFPREGNVHVRGARHVPGPCGHVLCTLISCSAAGTTGDKCTPVNGKT